MLTGKGWINWLLKYSSQRLELGTTTQVKFAGSTLYKTYLNLKSKVNTLTPKLPRSDS